MVDSRNTAPRNERKVPERLAPVELEEAQLDSAHGGTFDPICPPKAPSKLGSLGGR